MANIHISELKFHYPGEEAFGLEIPRLDVTAGDCVAIVGPSGSGKTTLLALASGILLPQSGEIHIGNICINTLGDSARRQYRIGRIGQVFQAFELLEYLNIIENILLPKMIASQTDARSRERAGQLLASVGLETMSAKHPSELSHGERQRVAVCRAMLNAPELILADEPTGNLDQNNKQNVVDLLISQARQTESTLLMVTHDRSLLDSFDRVIDFTELLGNPS